MKYGYLWTLWSVHKKTTDYTDSTNLFFDMERRFVRVVRLVAQVFCFLPGLAELDQCADDFSRSLRRRRTSEQPPKRAIDRAQELTSPASSGAASRRAATVSVWQRATVKRSISVTPETAKLRAVSL